MHSISPFAGKPAARLAAFLLSTCRNPCCRGTCKAAYPACRAIMQRSTILQLVLQRVRCGQCLLHLSQRKAGTPAKQPHSMCHEQEKQSVLHASQRKAGTHADHPARHVFLHLSPEKQEPLHCKDSCIAGSHAAVALASRQEKSRTRCMAREPPQ